MEEDGSAYHFMGVLFVISVVAFVFSATIAIKEKNFLSFKKILLFYLLNIVFFFF